MLTQKNKRYTASIDVTYVLLWMVAFLSAILCVIWKDKSNCSAFGVLLIITSVLTIYRCRKAPILLFFNSITGYINISVAVLDFIFMGSFSNEYQQGLRYSNYGLAYAKMFLLQCIILALFMTPTFIKRMTDKVSIFKDFGKSNSILAVVNIVAIIVIIFTQFEGSANQGQYVSNSNPLYEYAIFFFVLGFYYSKNNKTMRKVLASVSVIYILNGVLNGDRSSAFMMIIALFLLYFCDKVKMRTMLIYSFAGIVLANIIEIFRSTTLSFSGIVNALTQKSMLFFFSNTVSASFYSGITVMAYTEHFTGNKTVLIFKWIASLLFGTTEETNIVMNAQQYFHNGGGGLYPAYFGFFTGFSGVVFASVLLGFIIRKLFCSNSDWARLMQSAILIMVFRWYLYTPVSLYRTIFVNFNILIIIFYVADRMLYGTRHQK